MTAIGTMSGVREASGALDVAHRAVRRAGELGRAVVAELGFDLELAHVEGLLAARPATVDRELGLVFHAGDVAPRALGAEQCYWAEPSRHLRHAGLGATCRLECAGPTRWARLGAAVAQVSADVCRAGPAVGPAWCAAFTYTDAPPKGEWAGWPAAVAWRPALRFVVAARRARAAVAAVADPGRDPHALARELSSGVALARALARAADRSPPEPGGEAWSWADEAADGDGYEAAVARAVERIEAGALAKVVLARRVARRCGWAPARVLARLGALHPACAVFLVAPDAGRAFVGATPERLVSLDGDRFATVALAGSAPRGRDVAEDRELARALGQDPKERREHDLVARAIARALAPLSVQLDVARAPEIRALGTVQHLSTAIGGRIAAFPRPTLFELAGALHPTPALGGSPREPALALQRELEPFERGMYGGAVGWLDDAGSGDLAVAIRCGLYHGSPGELALYAGSGIVRGSDPARERAETMLKLRAVADAWSAAP